MSVNHPVAAGLRGAPWVGVLTAPLLLAACSTPSASSADTLAKVREWQYRYGGSPDNPAPISIRQEVRIVSPTEIEVNIDIRNTGAVAVVLMTIAEGPNARSEYSITFHDLSSQPVNWRIAGWNTELVSVPEPWEKRWSLVLEPDESMVFRKTYEFDKRLDRIYSSANYRGPLSINDTAGFPEGARIIGREDGPIRSNLCFADFTSGETDCDL